MNRNRNYPVLILAAALVVLALIALTAASVEARRGIDSDVYYFDPFPNQGDVVEGASARLVTNDAGATLQIKTRDLIPGDAVTIWWIIFNNPETCEGYPDGECTLNDLLGNTAAVGGDVGYATGRVVGGNGRAHFSAHLPTNGLDGWFGNNLTNPNGAEIHAIVHTHGQKIPGLVDEMISTFRAGCQDSEMINPDHPAYNDGTPGPNDCVDVQFTVFQQHN